MKIKLKFITTRFLIVLFSVCAVVIVYDILVQTGESKSFKDLTQAFQNKKDIPFIAIEKPAAQSILSSTKDVIVKGEASGVWFFEGQFDIALIDSNKHILSKGIALAQEEWMTTDAVSFEGTLSVPQVKRGSGFIVFTRENPSGDGFPNEFLLPILFE